MKRATTISVIRGLLLAMAASASAAVDPDLLILEAKIDGVGISVDAVNTRIEVVDAQFEEVFVEREQAILALSDARRRELERIMLDCARDPRTCIPPMYIITAVDPECSSEHEHLTAPALGDPHQHDVGAACPLKELLRVLIADYDAAEAQGLDRDYVTGRMHLDAALAASAATDARTSFAEACLAFKELACPAN